MPFDRNDYVAGVFRICFVCTGNICRSPMAETVFSELVTRAGLDRAIAVSSAGTGDWHVGEKSDERTVTTLAAKGYDGSKHRARQFDPDWFDSLDLVIAFDRSHERILKEWATNERDRSKVHLLLSFDKTQSGQQDVPDPYYSDPAFFDHVLSMVESATSALFDQIRPGINQAGINQGATS